MLSIKGKSKQWDGLPGGTRIGHVHLRAAELKKTYDFYTALGLQLTQEYGDQALFFAGGEYHHHIGLNTWESAGAAPLAQDTAGLRYFEILVESQELVDAIQESLEQAGFSVERSGAVLSSTDPNGIQLQIRPA
jgi:catechol 2,3-dioxygenase